MALHATHRDAGKVTVVDLSGRITLGRRQRTAANNDRGLLDDQRIKILLNLADVDYIDSSGIGELVSGVHGGKKPERRIEIAASDEKSP